MTKSEFVQKLKTMPEGLWVCNDTISGNIIKTTSHPIKVHTVRSNDFIARTIGNEKIYFGFPVNTEDEQEKIESEIFDNDKTWGYIKKYIPKQGSEFITTVTVAFYK